MKIIVTNVVYAKKLQLFLLYTQNIYLDEKLLDQNFLSQFSYT